jgi:hypothetical protein
MFVTDQPPHGRWRGFQAEFVRGAGGRQGIAVGQQQGVGLQRLHAGCRQLPGLDSGFEVPIVVSETKDQLRLRRQSFAHLAKRPLQNRQIEGFMNYVAQNHPPFRSVLGIQDREALERVVGCVDREEDAASASGPCIPEVEIRHDQRR